MGPLGEGVFVLPELTTGGLPGTRGITRKAPKVDPVPEFLHQSGASDLSTRQWGVSGKRCRLHTQQTRHLTGLNGVFVGLSSPPKVYLKEAEDGKRMDSRH